MIPIGQIFDIIQGHQITDEELYKTEGDIPVLTGRNEIKGYWNKSIVNKEQLPCITYPTKGNAGIAFVQQKIFDANNTAVLTVKKDWVGKINLDWFALKLGHIFREIQTSKEGVSYLNKEIVEPYEVMIPEIKDQLKEYKYLKRLTDFRDNLTSLLEKVENLLNKSIVYSEDI